MADSTLINKDALSTLLLVGEQMSNVIFNLGQNNGPLAKWKPLQVQWDDARRKLRPPAKRKGRKR